MLIDFEKAFDSLSWKFLYNTLVFFGYNKDFIKWIKLFNNNISAFVLQSGFMSEPISIKRGCRQGDPISSYLFLIGAEMRLRVCLLTEIKRYKSAIRIRIRIYKLASCSIAERLRHTLDSIISNCQTGFIKGRFLSDSTRLIYDILHVTEKNNIPGLLMLIDFEKAFDSLSWKFLYNTLVFFGYNKDFIKWIKLFNNNISAFVLQSGFMSEPISIKRGCRQGDPISSYLFLIGAEMRLRVCLLTEIKRYKSAIRIRIRIYKLASCSIAERLRHTLDSIISNCQTGFIKGRFLSDSTRLIYDILHVTEKNNIPGLLMLIDFEKAFDSLSWKFLYNTLVFFGYNKDFIKWIKLFNNNISAFVLQSGFMSEPISIKRGCRQGDPISSYLFLIGAEILSRLILNNKDIIGIIIDGFEFKLTQFVDDTTLLLDGSQHSLQSALNTLEIYGTMSGLKMNKEKTKIIWIGRKRFSKEKLKVSVDMEWGASQFTMLGLDFFTNLNKNQNQNIIMMKPF